MLYSYVDVNFVSIMTQYSSFLEILEKSPESTHDTLHHNHDVITFLYIKDIYTTIETNQINCTIQTT